MNTLKNRSFSLRHECKIDETLLVRADDHALGNRRLSRRLGAETVVIPEEEDALSLSDSTIAGLYPLAHAGALVKSLDEADGSFSHVCLVVPTHDGLNGLGGLVRVVEGDGADVVVQHMSLDNAVHQVAANEAKLSVDGGGGAAHEVPFVRRVVWKRWVGMLEICDGN